MVNFFSAFFLAVSSENTALKTDSSGAPKTPKPLSAIHAQKLENRIKMELVEQGDYQCL